MKHYTDLINRLAATKGRSAWAKGVRIYAEELLTDLIDNIEHGYLDSEDVFSNYNMFSTALLNGAYSWNEYSWGGCSLICDHQIAERLCNNSELKKTDHGRLNPNKHEQWLDVQARALYQASRLLWDISKEV